MDCLLGFRDEPYRLDPLRRRCGRRVRIATDTGSYGHHGFVTELLQPQNYDCGVYLRAGAHDARHRGRSALPQAYTCYVSMERKMACGLGACLGCTCKTENGRACVHLQRGPGIRRECVL